MPAAPAMHGTTTTAQMTLRTVPQVVVGVVVSRVALATASRTSAATVALTSPYTRIEPLVDVLPLVLRLGTRPTTRICGPRTRTD